MIQHHVIGFGGSALAVHPDASALPTADTIRRLLGGQNSPHLDLVIVFGYKDAQLASNDTRMKLWIDGLTDLVRSNWFPGNGRSGLQVERMRGELLIEVASDPGEAWEHTAKRYDGLLHDMGIRLDTINSLHRSNAVDLSITAARHRTLGRNLGRVPGEGYGRFIRFLNSHAILLSKHTQGLNKTAIEEGEALLGLFIPDASTDAESWWGYAEPWVLINRTRGMRKSTVEVLGDLINGNTADTRSRVADAEVDEDLEMNEGDMEQVIFDSGDDMVDDVEDDAGET
ncbi:hypothetical protein HBH98_172230 [Parastagonospora nodorum]|nr:hypothetical protein HBH52_180440 [Parastagonospora nodorum]KAH3991284.1 hypothetical protein HBI10_235620 [Parastagonospora nodorum]KAH4008859.1 hypothetical protein HBI13_227230 [Parastagonospora nodorum]KAH4101111.1 hypothetical protein HBH46_143120 [Parastagonospora nodorum]KAH4163701.1 hypothetical protein HBH43_154010 [Parastagonospora nodorum]